MLKIERPAPGGVILLLSCVAIAASLAAKTRPGMSAQRQQARSEAAVQAASVPRQAILVRAIQLHQAGDFDGAIREYRRYLSADPNSFVARANLGAALAHRGRYAEAIAEYKRALKIQPSNPQVRLNLAIAHYQALELADAIRELTPLHAAAPSNLQIALLLGDSYFRLGEYKETAEVLEPFASADSGQKALDYLLGMALLREGQVQKAEMLINRILSNGDSAQAHLMLGEARLSINDTPGAIDELKQALRLAPKLPLAHWLYGKALLESGHRNQALTAFREELAIDPNEYDPNIYLGALLNELLQYKKALPYLHRALEVRPGSPQTQYQIAVAEIGLGNLQDAKRALESLVKANPNFVEAHISLASVYYRLHMTPAGNRERAIVMKLNAQIQASKKAQASKASYDGSAVPPGGKAENHSPETGSSKDP